jgi:hypothetical protein
MGRVHPEKSRDKHRAERIPFFMVLPRDFCENDTGKNIDGNISVRRKSYLINCFSDH